MKLTAILALLLSPFLLLAQNSEGSIEFEEVIQIQIKIEDIPEEYREFAAMIPKERKSNMVLHFNSAESMYKESAIPVESDNNPFGEGRGGRGGMRMMGMTGETYIDIKEDAGVQFQDMMGKKFLIELPKEKTKWKLTNIQEEIAGYMCIKATTEIDSNEVIAWFAPQIPVPTGPRGMNDLPGAILKVEMAVERGYLTVTAKTITLEPLKEEIKEPTKGEKVTEDEFREIMRERFEEMRKQMDNRRRNGGEGGGRIMIGPGGR